MPEASLHYCLDLCAQAREANDLDNETLARTLIELQQTLQLLNDDEAKPTENSDLSWKHEPVIIMDIAGYLTGWNRGAQILFGYTAEEAVGRNISFLVPDDLAPG